jgi:hypothetical protein
VNATRITVVAAIGGIVAGSMAAIAAGNGWDTLPAMLVGIVAGAIAAFATIAAWA